jgi:quinol monooxygenase YgiN
MLASWRGGGGTVPEIWTLARWTVMPGKEDQFVAAWREMAERTLEAFAGASGTLLRDRAQPNIFFSFGPWEDAEAVTRWRASPAFLEGLARMKPLLASSEPHTLDRAASAGPAT